MEGLRGRGRHYPPVAAIALVLFLALAVLPSSLLLPQSSPATTLEYAPVPPSDDAVTPPGGNLSSLGLGSSSTLGELTSFETPPPRGARSVGKNPSTKLCVGSPPRQSEDLMAPPCVAFFDGDNFGSTYAGVTRDEIRVVVFMDAGFTDSGDGRGEQTPPSGSYCDLDKPPSQGGEGCWTSGTRDEHTWVKWIRAYNRYFNARFQTYNRHVHYWVYWSGLQNATPEGKRSIAAEHLQKIKPFAALDETAFSGNDEAYLDAMARGGVLLFSGLISPQATTAVPAAVYRRYAPRFWGFHADVEHWAKMYSSYVCTRVAGFPVSHAPAGVSRDGSPMNGRQRRYALMSTSDPAYPNVHLFASLVKQDLKACGVEGLELTYPRHGVTVFFNDPNPGAQAAQNVASMRQNDVTTVLWLGGGEIYTGVAADQAKYYPEIVVAGDGAIDRNANAKLMNQNWWRHAWLTSNQLRVDTLAQDPGVAACREGDPSLSERSCAAASQFYRDHFMMFKAIQVAGPRLTPDTIDRGMHAIPKIASDSPYTAACFFEPDDYTCVKDAVEEWWDPTGRVPGTSSPGCYRMTRGGRRFLAGTWLRGDDVFTNPSDPCNAFSGGGVIDS